MNTVIKHYLLEEAFCQYFSRRIQRLLSQRYNVRPGFVNKNDWNYWVLLDVIGDAIGHSSGKRLRSVYNYDHALLNSYLTLLRQHNLLQYNTKISNYIFRGSEYWDKANGKDEFHS